MSHHCHEEGCENHSHGHMSNHHHHHGCGHCQQHCCCPCHSHHHEEQEECLDKGHHLLDLADQAWMEVLKEKIKDHIRATDHKIDEMAKIVAETNREYWHHKMAKAKTQEEYESQLSHLFDQSKNNKKSKP